MGSYPNDKVPKLTEYSFETINTPPSNDKGNHCMLIARLDKTYYFATSLGQKEKFFPF